MSTNKNDKTRIIQIWGEILDEGFTTVPNILLKYRKNLRIKAKHLVLIIDIMSFKWNSENPFPSYTTLAKRAGMEERSVKRTMQELEELHLLRRTQRFNKESGAQITTTFDFRPLVKKLNEEKSKSKKDENDIDGMTKLSRGRVTKLSPKEYTYINNNNISINPIKKEKDMTELSQFINKKTKKEEKERVRKYLRNGIFRKRIFETFDNLNNKLSINELVEEGSYKASKELIVNRLEKVLKTDMILNPVIIAKKVREKFPYEKIPKDSNNIRKFYVAKICDITSEEIMNYLTS